jgi:lipopolysaccharide biosynthesis regulator YciM
MSFKFYKELSQYLSPEVLQDYIVNDYIVNEDASFQTEDIEALSTMKQSYPFAVASLYDINEPSEKWVEELTNRFLICYKVFEETGEWKIPLTEMAWVEDNFEVEPKYFDLDEMNEVYEEYITPEE